MATLPPGSSCPQGPSESTLDRPENPAGSPILTPASYISWTTKHLGECTRPQKAHTLWPLPDQ